MREDYLARHRAHDYPHLVERWRAVAARTGLAMRRFVTGPEYNLYHLRSRAFPRQGGIYISAGIHGDEPGATEALITWAEKNTRLLKSRPFFLVPCINPWGLMNNCRMDSAGRDLNRSFRDDTVQEIVALRKAIGARRFALALTLHEDYDALGLYLYELQGATPYWGEKLLAAAKPYIPADTRPMIEAREAIGGLVRPPLDLSFFDKIGLPEAVYLYLRNCLRVFTVETPSEYGLDRRIKAHVAIIEECVRRTAG